jgi:hypothetical protein
MSFLEIGIYQLFSLMKNFNYKNKLKKYQKAQIANINEVWYNLFLINYIYSHIIKYNDKYQIVALKLDVVLRKHLSYPFLNIWLV